MAPESAAITFEDVRKVYDSGGRPALDGVLEHGQLQALMLISDAGVRELMQTPRRQAERLDALLDGGARA